MVAYSHAQDLYPTDKTSRHETNHCADSSRLCMANPENRIPIRLYNRLTQYSQNTTSASAKPTPKTASRSAFAIGFHYISGI